MKNCLLLFFCCTASLMVFAMETRGVGELVGEDDARGRLVMRELDPSIRRSRSHGCKPFSRSSLLRIKSSMMHEQLEKLNDEENAQKKLINNKIEELCNKIGKFRLKLGEEECNELKIEPGALKEEALKRIMNFKSIVKEYTDEVGVQRQMFTEIIKSYSEKKYVVIQQLSALSLRLRDQKDGHIVGFEQQSGELKHLITQLQEKTEQYNSENKIFMDKLINENSKLLRNNMLSENGKEALGQVMKFSRENKDREFSRAKSNTRSWMFAAAVVTSCVWYVAILVLMHNDDAFRAAVENKIASIFSYGASFVAS
jgi:hypothetical protein